MEENKRECGDTSCTEECCSGCEHACGGQQPDSLIEPTNEYNDIKKIIGVVSGKGGVGKSLVTSLLAVTMQRAGYKTAILDADITGPSIPKTFKLEEKAVANELGIFPVKTKTGIETMSVNSILENDTDPVVWRGPVIAGTVKQFWTDVLWGDIDYMFIDMPPGTGDVPLTVFQSIPVDGIVIVTSPQELVSMIVTKAVKMAELEYSDCGSCGKHVLLYLPGQRKGLSDFRRQPYRGSRGKTRTGYSGKNSNRSETGGGLRQRND